MAYTDWELPFVNARVFDVLKSPTSVGVSIRRQRWPIKNPPRRFQVHYEHTALADVQTVIAAIDAVKGAAVDFALTLPDVGAVQVRFADDGYTYRVANGNQRHLVVNLDEEYRI